MKTIPRRITCSTLAALALMACAPAAMAQSASGPATMIVSFPPGGAADSVARVLALEMSAQTDQRVVVLNVAGAGGSIGTAKIAAAAPNGLTMGFVTAASLTTLPQLQPTPYGLDSVDYVCRAFEVPIFLLSAPTSPLRSLKDVIDFATANPGKLNYATVGPGSLPHLTALDFERRAKITLNHIPYKGEAPAIMDLLARHVDVYFGTNAVATAHNLRRLAVASASRVDEAPDAPTFAESGLAVQRSVMGGVIAPKGMDVQSLSKMRESCASATRSAAFKDVIDRMKLRAAFAPGDEFEKAVRAESGANTTLLREAGLLKQKP